MYRIIWLNVAIYIYLLVKLLIICLHTSYIVHTEDIKMFGNLKFCFSPTTYTIPYKIFKQQYQLKYFFKKKSTSYHFVCVLL